MVPDDLAETLVATSLSTNAVFWIVLGVASAYIFARAARTQEPISGAGREVRLGKRREEHGDPAW